MKKEIGFIGLGKMGFHMVSRLRKKGWKVVGFDVDSKISDMPSVQKLVEHLLAPRIVWIMVPSGKPVEETIFGKQGLAKFLQKGDIIVDGGNSYYKDSISLAEKLKKLGIHFLDVGVSGGPVSIKLGKFAIMAGGEKETYKNCRPIFQDLSKTPSGYMGKSGAGHFVKMIHNGIEYGMMQSIAEGFSILKKSSFNFTLKDVAEIYNHNSIITSRLVAWAKEGFEQYGQDLNKASGSVAHTGEGEWTVKTAKKLRVPAPILEGAFKFRVESHKSPSYTGKILSMLRAVFGGHKI